MEEEIWEPALPISPGTFGQDDKQQLLWGYPGIAWAVGAALEFVLDLNTRMIVYLRDHFSVTGGDNTTLVRRKMDELTTGDANQKFLQIIADATAAME